MQALAYLLKDVLQERLAHAHESGGVDHLLG